MKTEIVSAADVATLAASACGQSMSYVRLMFSESLNSVSELGASLLESSDLIATLTDDSSRIAVAHVADWRPFDSVCTLRLFPLNGGELAGDVASTVVREALRFARSRLGCRKVSFRFPSLLGAGESLYRSAFEELPVEGALRDFWYGGETRHAEVICADTIGRSTHGVFAPQAAVFGPPTPSLAAWAAWKDTRFSDRPLSSAVTLDQMRESDLAGLHAIETDARLPGWIFRGASPGLAEFQAHLAAGVTLQYVVRGVDGEVLGRVLLYDVSRALHHGKVAVVVRPDLWRTGVAARVTLDFIRRCFNQLPLELLCFETSALAPESGVRALAKSLQMDAHLVDDRAHVGTPYDRFIFSLSRQEATRLPLLRRIVEMPALESAS